MELEIVKFLNRTGGSRLGFAAEMVSQIVILAVFWSVMAGAFLVFDLRNGQKIFLALVLAAFLHFAISEGVMKYFLPKFFGIRRRPYLAHPEIIVPHGQNHNDSSFPSNHMSTTLAMLTVVVYFYPIIWPLALAFSLFMAYARMRNGMHYPSDVLAGTILGIIYAFLAIWLTA